MRLVILSLFLLACTAELPTETSLDSGMSAVVFYGVIAGADGVIPSATVEVYCETCEWNEVTYTDEYGVYALIAGRHIGHSGSIMAGAPGYLGTLYPYDGLTEYSNRVDIILEPY